MVALTDLWIPAFAGMTVCFAKVSAGSSVTSTDPNRLRSKRVISGEFWRILL